MQGANPCPQYGSEVNMLSATDVINKLTDLQEHYAFYESELRTINEAIQLLKSYKQADKECIKVVRCINCKNKDNALKCPIALIAGAFAYEVDDNWFCADGVRNDD